MAKLKVFTVYDSAVGTHTSVHAEISQGVARRNFKDIAMDARSPLNKHPHDYVLFEVGEMDSVTGVITCHTSPINLGSAASYLDAGVEQGVGLQSVK